MRTTAEILRLLTVAFPLKTGHHAVTLDTTSNHAVLMLHVCLGETEWRTITGGDEDLDRSAEDIVKDAVGLIRAVS